MEDKRNLTIGIRFPADNVVSGLSEIMEKIRDVKGGFQDTEEAAVEFGSQAAESAGTMAKGMEAARRESDQAARSMDCLSDANESVQDSIQNARAGFSRFGSSAENDVRGVKNRLDQAGAAASELGSEAAKSAGAVSAGMKDAGEAAGNAADALGDTAGAGTKVQRSYVKMGTEAKTFREAVIKTSADAIKSTNSLAKTVRAGMQGAYGFAGKQVQQFGEKAKSISTAFAHPIRTIKTGLTDALERARKKLGDVGGESDDVGDKLRGMGDDGESAGARIKSAVGSAVTSFFAISAAIEVVKAGIETMKSFAGAVINAGMEAEQAGAKFSASFSADSGVKEWAENFSGAIHRSNTEVQGFLVSNKKLYQELGITGEAANDLSKITTSFAYDLGAAFKMDDAEALSVVQDYINGNISALSEYGVQIDETVLKQSAMAMGLGKNIDSLDEAAMAQVRMNALLQNSTAIQQAAAKKQEGYANGIKSLKGIWTDFLTSAGEKFAPVFTELTNSILTSWPQIEPALTGIVDMLSNGLAAGMPVITELAVSAVPFLTQTLGELFTAAEPIGGVMLDLATTALPPLVSAAAPVVSTFSTLAQAVLPPLSRIISSIATVAVPPLVSILKSLSENVITPLMPSIESIANSILPALSAGLELIPPVLRVISPILSGIAEVLSRVVGFLSRIAEWAAGGLGSLLDKATSFFNAGSAAGSAGAQIPHNADGDPDFKGGWTHINERGGELAFLPSGSAIIPADKSEQIINSSQSRNVSVSSPFNPVINIHVSGSTEADVEQRWKEEARSFVMELYQELKDKDALDMAIQFGNA